MVGAAAFAGAAADALRRLFRKRRVAASRPVRQTVPGQISLKQEHAGNADTRAAWLAVIASAAELGTKGIADGAHLGFFLHGQRGTIVYCGEILIQLGNVRRTGYHHGDIRVGADAAQRRHGVLDRAARKGLHGDEADVLFGAGVDQFFCLIFHDVVWEHDGFHPWQLQRHPEGFQRVGSDADMADLPCLFGFHQRFQRKPSPNPQGARCESGTSQYSRCGDFSG